VGGGRGKVGKGQEVEVTRQVISLRTKAYILSAVVAGGNRRNTRTGPVWNERPALRGYWRPGFLPSEMRERNRAISRSQILTISDMHIMPAQKSQRTRVPLGQADLMKHRIGFQIQQFPARAKGQRGRVTRSTKVDRTPGVSKERLHAAFRQSVPLIAEAVMVGPCVLQAKPPQCLGNKPEAVGTIVRQCLGMRVIGVRASLLDVIDFQTQPA